MEAVCSNEEVVSSASHPCAHGFSKNDLLPGEVSPNQGGVFFRSDGRDMDQSARTRKRRARALPDENHARRTSAGNPLGAENCASTGTPGAVA